MNSSTTKKTSETKLVLNDGTVFDLGVEFPSANKVALSMSGGVESTLLAALLVNIYGADNVSVFSGQYTDRRRWESSHPKMLCKLLGIQTHHAIPQTNHHMAPMDNWNMFIQAKQEHGFDLWFNGTNAKLFSPSNISDPADVNAINALGYIIPFVNLEKHHTIGLYYLMDLGWLLEMTHSCTELPPEQGHCGACYCCHERRYGFHVLGTDDVTIYRRPPHLVLKDALAVLNRA